MWQADSAGWQRHNQQANRCRSYMARYGRCHQGDTHADDRVICFSWFRVGWFGIGWPCSLCATSFVPTLLTMMLLLLSSTHAQDITQEVTQDITSPPTALLWLNLVAGVGVMLLVLLGLVASRSVYGLRRDMAYLRRTLADTQQQRHDLETTLREQARHIRTLQHALSHLSDGVYHLDDQGRLLEVISSTPDKIPSHDPHTHQHTHQHTPQAGQPLEALFPHTLALDVRGLLERTLTRQQPQHQPYHDPHQTPTKHYQLHCFPTGTDCDVATQHPKEYMHKDAHNQRARGGFLIVRDVSDAVTLQQSEQRNKTILATLPDAIGRFSRRGYYLEIINTGTFTQVLTREQLEGKHILDYLPYATAKKMQRHIDALYATGEVQSFYYHLYNDSGKRVYRHIRLVLLNAREHIAIMRDVTEHIQTERALEQSEARFREIVATIDAVFFVFDLVSQHFRYVSPAFDTIVGASRQLLYDFSDIQTTFSHLIYPADWQAFHEAFTRMSEGHEVVLEYRLRHASSGLRWLRTHVSRGYTVSATVSATVNATVSAETTPTHSYQDDLDSATADQHMIGVTTDITEHKHAEAALSSSEARLHAILQALPDGIGRFSREGRYLEVLHQGYYTPITPTQDIIGKSIAEVLPHEAAERARQHIGRIFAGSPLEVFEYDVILTDTTHHREIYLVPFDAESCIGVVHDITERKRAELALSQALTEKTTLLNEIHHRVKNNLQVIVSLLILQARATANPAVKDALNANRQRITAMATVHKLMYASGSLSEVNFHDYLRAIVPNLLPPQGAPAVNINITTAISLPIEDAIPLGIITAELLENIFKHAFTDPHPPSHPMNANTNKDDVFSDDFSSEATLRAEAFNEFDEPAEIPADDSAPTVTLALEQHQHTLTLQVHDNGVGLPETFDCDNLQQHTSLGISIIDALVSQIGGTWRMARSTPGTLVEVTFEVLEPPHIMPE